MTCQQMQHGIFITLMQLGLLCQQMQREVSFDAPATAYLLTSNADQVSYHLHTVHTAFGLQRLMPTTFNADAQIILVPMNLLHEVIILITCTTSLKTHKLSNSLSNSDVSKICTIIAHMIN